MRALGCSDPSAARTLLRARGSLQMVDLIGLAHLECMRKLPFRGIPPFSTGFYRKILDMPITRILHVASIPMRLAFSIPATHYLE